MATRIQTLPIQIEAFCNAPGAERNLYELLKKMLCETRWGVEADAASIVIDSPIPQTRCAPDLTFYLLGENNRPITSAAHVFASIEVKRGNSLERTEAEVLSEKNKYITETTAFFYLVDQTQVIRFKTTTGANQLGDRASWTWAQLHDVEIFKSCFGPLGKAYATLANTIADFKNGTTGFSYVPLRDDNRREFIDSVRIAATTIRDAVSVTMNNSLIPQLGEAVTHLDGLKESWGQWQLEWNDGPYPVIHCEQASELSGLDLREYEGAIDAVSLAIEPFAAALKLETVVLPKTAARMGIDTVVSLLLPTIKKSKLTDSGKAFESLVYETSSLILSRMLMVRFAEDHQLLKRYICNGGIEQFSKFADHFKIGSQGLLREVYRKARDLYSSIFSEDPLDWAIAGDDAVLSDALLHSMWLLSRWDFKTVHGDILSGVYDKYLDASKRRALGEVYTRPEICRYMIERCDIPTGGAILDPSCGSGTFLVERLHSEISRLKRANALTPEAVKHALSQIHGLDLNPFAGVMTQIQLLWQMLDVFSSNTPDEQRRIAKLLIPYMMIESGHTSLDVFGQTMATNTNFSMEFGESVTSGGMRHSVAHQVRRRFKLIATQQYDAVLANPPYIRAHRRSVDDSSRSAYQEVMSGQVDLYILFLYRALRSWLKPGRRMAFIVPISILEAQYASELRRVLLSYKIVEIVDLECLRKTTFRGIKRPTVILIIENSPSSPDDEIAVRIASMACYDKELDVINIEKAPVTTLKKRHILLSNYLSASGDSPANSILSKLQLNDQPVLAKLAGMAKLEDHVSIAFRRRRRGIQPNIASEILPGTQAHDWEPRRLMGKGLELGGPRVFTQTGRSVYKGLNVFPTGLAGEPMGHWDGTTDPQSPNLYTYESLFESSQLFVSRELAQLPTISRVPKDVVFTNTVILIHLSKRFPLHGWVLSAPVMYAAALMLRATIIEDLGCHWYPSNLAAIPMPTNWTEDQLVLLEKSVDDLLTADKGLANGLSVIQAKLTIAQFSISQLIARGDPIVSNVVLPEYEAELPDSLVDDSNLGCLKDSENRIFIQVPNDSLRVVVRYLIQAIDPSDYENSQIIGEIKVPNTQNELDVLAQDILDFESDQAQKDFDVARLNLDNTAGKMLGLSLEEVEFIRHRMANDEFLSKLRPMWAHRGLHVQGYTDHSGGGRFDN
jgi:hypothetical protein